jgi:hypothetical protein
VFAANFFHCRFDFIFKFKYQSGPLVSLPPLHSQVSLLCFHCCALPTTRPLSLAASHAGVVSPPVTRMCARVPNHSKAKSPTCHLPRCRLPRFLVTAAATRHAPRHSSASPCSFRTRPSAHTTTALLLTHCPLNHKFSPHPLPHRSTASPLRPKDKKLACKPTVTPREHVIPRDPTGSPKFHISPTRVNSVALPLTSEPLILSSPFQGTPWERAPH